MGIKIAVYDHDIAAASRTDADRERLLAAVKESNEEGFCVHPPTQDGEKKPLGKWKEHQTTRTTTAQLRSWYRAKGRTGFGIICGRVSGGLEMFEAENEGDWSRLKEAAAGVGLGDLLDRIYQGWADGTPGGGIHGHYRTAEPSGNEKLAMRQIGFDQAGKVVIKPIFETRGEGGYTVCAPSYGSVHPSGKPYVRLSGGPRTIATITAEEREALWNLARAFDEMPKPAEDQHGDPFEVVAVNGNADHLMRPGDDFNNRTTWPEILKQYGWTEVCRTSDGKGYWRRPGKQDGWSATTNHGGSDLFYLFTTSSQLQAGKSYSRFGFYAHMEHSGDYSQAGKALRAKGYGSSGRYLNGHSSPPTNDSYRNGKVGDGSGGIGRLRETSGDFVTSEASRSIPNSPKSPKSPNEPTAACWEGLSDADLGMLDLSTVTAKAVRWLLKYRIPLGKFTLIAGEGGLGKTFLLLSIAAGISVGGPAPGGEGENYPLGDVIILTAEDDPEDTIVPRLNAMGADLKRIVVLGTAKLPNGRMEPIKLSDIDRLREVIKRRPETKMIFVDPMPSFLGRGVDDGKNAELRTILGPLSDFAKDLGIAVVGVTHFNKSANAKAAQRVMGSVAYSNVARATWCLVEDPEQEARRLLLPVKNNLSPVRNNGLAFTLTDGCVVWEDEGVSTPINDVLGGNAGTSSPAARRGFAVQFLKDLLTGKMVPGDEVIAKAKEKGFGKNLVWEVKAEAGVRNIKEKFRGGWSWTIDPPAEKPPEKLDPFTMTDINEPDFGPPPPRAAKAQATPHDPATPEPPILDWIRSYFYLEPSDCLRTIIEKAEEDFYDEATLRAAAKALGMVVTYRDGEEWWEMPSAQPSAVSSKAFRWLYSWLRTEASPVRVIHEECVLVGLTPDEVDRAADDPIFGRFEKDGEPHWRLTEEF